jgi:hypothetical protein
MALPKVFCKGNHILENPGTDRIQMDIAGQLQKVRIVFADDRFIPILKQMVRALVPSIEVDHIAREKPSHALGKGLTPRPHQ